MRPKPIMPHLYTEAFANFFPYGVYSVTQGGSCYVAAQVVYAANIFIQVLLEHPDADVNHVPRG